MKNVSPKPRRGRRRRVDPASAFKRAQHLQRALEMAKAHIDWPKLLTAKTEQDVDEAFGNVPPSYSQYFLTRREPPLRSIPTLILECLREPTFPRQEREAQIRYVAESLGSDSLTSIRRSRDICRKERSKRRKQGKILRREYYIECSCGYKGPAKDGSCRRCGTTEMG